MTKFIIYFLTLSCLSLTAVAQIAVSPYRDDQISLSPFENGVAKVVENGTVYYINTEGKRFEVLAGGRSSLGDKHTIGDYKNELEQNPQLLPKSVLQYRTEKGFGMLSPTAEVLLDAGYDYIDTQNRNFWKLSKSGKVSYLLPDRTVLPFFEEIGYLDGEYFDVKQEGKWHLYNKNQQKITTTEAYDGFDYCGGCAMRSSYLYAQRNGKWGIIDWDGKVLVPFQYEHAHHQMRNDHWVASFSKDGKPVIVHIPTQKEFFHGTLMEGVLVTKENDKYGAFGAEGNLTIPFEYDLIELPNDNSYLGYYGQYFITTKADKKGVTDREGRTIIPNAYEHIMVYDNYFVGKRNNVSYLLNEKQDVLLELENADISHINDYFYSSGSDGLAIFKVKNRGYYGLYFAETDTYIEPAFYTVYVTQSQNNKQEARKTIQTDRNGLISAFDLSGNLLLEDCGKVSYSYGLPDNFIVFTKNDQAGIFDLDQRREIVPPLYTHLDVFPIGGEKAIKANLFSEAHAPYSGALSYHLYDMQGKKLIDADIAQIDSVTSDVLLLKIKDGGYLLWDHRKRSSQKLAYKAVYPVQSPHLLLVADNEDMGKLYDIRTQKELQGSYNLSWIKSGYLPENPNGEPTLFRFKEGMALIYNKNGYGYINDNGKQVVKPQYDWAFDFVGDVAMVCRSEDGDRNTYLFKMSYIDKQGKPVFPMEFDFDNLDLNHEDSFFVGETVKLTKRKGRGYLYGLGNVKSGQILLPIDYEQMRTIQNGKWLLLEQKRKYGIADSQGNIVVPVEYDHIIFRTSVYYNWTSEESIFPLLVSQDGKWRYLNEDGTYLPVVGNYASEY
ncbi:WG repeat-containing protein [Olivibacter sitiensis]|uniref:WG repeat-containing protein n=1 Tax=Olivibacter sitiensis TaxID=376470 RepID=UPI000429FABE|nr:WG repeat-containing protein [Olivibacter sitiensis]